jgi:hypothetical protein
MYRAPSGTRAAMNTGVVTQITPSVNEAFATLENSSLKDLPIASSTLNMSVENLLRIRPTGVVLVHVSGHLVQEIEWWWNKPQKNSLDF